MAGRIRVVVDECLSDLISNFLERKRGEISGILDAVPRHDYQSIGDTAHRLKGEGGSYGFDTMTVMGRALEQAAAIGDDGAVIRLAQELLAYVNDVEVVFQRIDD